MTLTVPDHPYVAVLDFGGQYAHLIANRIRRLGVYSEIFPSDVPPEDLKAALGVILSGGPSSVYDRQQPPFHAGLFELEQPMLGLCYGHQLLARQLGGEVARGQVHEYGAADLQVVEPVDILEGLAEREKVWMSHGDQVTSLPEGFRILAGTPDCPVAAMGDRALAPTPAMSPRAWRRPPPREPGRRPTSTPRWRHGSRWRRSTLATTGDSLAQAAYPEGVQAWYGAADSEWVCA